MSVDIGLDPTTDDLPDKPVEITGQGLVIQRVQNEIKLITNEWYLDLTRGLPLVDWIRSKGVDPAAVLARIETAARSVPGVVTTRNGAATFELQRLDVSVEVVFDGGAAEVLALQTASQQQQLNGTPFLVFFRPGVAPTNLARF